MTRFSMHSGEEGPAAWVKTTVQDLGINRIDHGVRSADDPEVLKYLAEQKTFLTVCPGGCETEDKLTDVAAANRSARSATSSCEWSITSLRSH